MMNLQESVHRWQVNHFYWPHITIDHLYRRRWLWKSFCIFLLNHSLIKYDHMIQISRSHNPSITLMIRRLVLSWRACLGWSTVRTDVMKWSSSVWRVALSRVITMTTIEHYDNAYTFKINCHLQPQSDCIDDSHLSAWVTWCHVIYDINLPE